MISLSTISLFSAYAATGVAGLITMKHAFNGMGKGSFGPPVADLISPQLLVGATLYAVSFLIWLRILSSHQLSVAFPIAVGVTVAGSSIGSMIVLNESFDPLKMVATLFVIIAVILFAIR